MNDLPEGCYRTVRKDAALGALTRDELSSHPARTRVNSTGQIHYSRSVTAGTLHMCPGSNQSGLPP